MIVRHRINVRKADAAGACGVAAYIENRLAVECHVSSAGEGYGWFIDWTGSETADLDFLKPHILPPEKHRNQHISRTTDAQSQ